MDQRPRPNRIEKLYLEIHSYVELLFLQIKLSIIDGLSVICSEAISAIIASFFFCMAFIFLSVLATYALWLVLDSVILSMLIMSCFFILLGLIFWSMRKNMFTDAMVKIFARAFFDHHTKPSTPWKNKDMHR